MLLHPCKMSLVRQSHPWDMGLNAGDCLPAGREDGIALQPEGLPRAHADLRHSMRCSQAHLREGGVACVVWACRPQGLVISAGALSRATANSAAANGPTHAARRAARPAT